jgi:hypothetical protein
MCDHNSIPSYSIALGIVLYAGIYVYLLYNNSAVSYMFNKFLIYIVSIDLLLSTLYFYKSKPDNIVYQPIAQYDLHNINDNDDVTDESEIEIANEGEGQADIEGQAEIEAAIDNEVVNDIPLLNETLDEIANEDETQLNEIQNDLDLTQTIEETDQENPRKRRGRPPKQSIAL